MSTELRGSMSLVQLLEEMHAAGIVPRQWRGRRRQDRMVSLGVVFWAMAMAANAPRK